MKVQNPAFRDIYETNSILWYNHLKHMTTEKYDNNGTAWYFRFDDDNELQIYPLDHLNVNGPVGITVQYIMSQDPVSI